ncbi:hypothetical protein [Massilia oculi]|uniref:hypothetical protein n=1 Tax=Massilia oculi TaxID=945844 RepID=UPI0028B13460|nr:hypothetical protein [Massilia oculi]
MRWLLRTKLLPQKYRFRLRWRYLDRDDDIEYQFLQEDESRFYSQVLLQRARDLRIPIPPVYVGRHLSDDWERSGIDGNRYFLSLAGGRKLRAEIDEEERKLAERRARSIPYITALTGLIGAITGLVAVWAK